MTGATAPQTPCVLSARTTYHPLQSITPYDASMRSRPDSPMPKPFHHTPTPCKRRLTPARWPAIVAWLSLALAALLCAPAAFAANVLVVTTAENATTDGGAGLNIVNNYIADIQSVPGHTVTVDLGGLTDAALAPAYFSGYDIVFVMGVYQAILPANVASLNAAMAANGSSAFVLFIDTCIACSPTAPADLLALLNTVAPASVTVSYGARHPGFVNTTLNTATNPHASYFASKPVYYGVEYQPLLMPSQYELYLDGTEGYMISIPRLQSRSASCVIATSDTSGFASVPGVDLYPQNQGISGLIIDAMTAPGGMCNAVTLRLRKQLPDGRVAASDQFTLDIVRGTTTATATTTGSGTTATGEALYQATTASGAHVFGETMANGSTSTLTAYRATHTCTNANPASTTPMPGNVAGTSFSLSPNVGDDITCVISNALPRADLSVAKTNTPATGPDDQPSDTVVAGTTTTYTIRVSNAGPDSAAGALVRDAATQGLSACVVSVPCAVVSGTAACPAPADLTYANLSTTGVAIPLLGPNSAIAFDVRCTVD